MPKIYSKGAVLLSGRYEVLDYLDEGGMQEVYLASDLVFRRTLVIKVPKIDSAIKRFKNSAQLSARVTHPNLAKTYDYFEENGRAHLVEEYINGGNLSAVLTERVEAVDPFLVARILNNVAQGLAAAHHLGIVHRDLKPSNLMLSGSFQRFSVKITDFGVAKMAEEEIGFALAGGGGTIAASKTAVGHLPYMSPELIAEPSKVRRPSDIWAVGALAYELLSGIKPYGEGLVAVSRIMAAEPLVVPNYVQVSRQFNALGNQTFEIIVRCMNVDAEKRPSADDLKEMSGNLCYGEAPRCWGRVSSRGATTGKIVLDSGEQIFFHDESVYGPKVRDGDEVLIAAFDGAPYKRAQPVLKKKR